MAKPEDVVIDSMSTKDLKDLEPGKESVRSVTPDEEKGFEGPHHVRFNPRPF